MIWKPIPFPHSIPSLSRELNSSVELSYSFRRSFLDHPGPRWFLLLQRFSGAYYLHYQFYTYNFMQRWLYLTHLLISKYLLNSHHGTPLGRGIHKRIRHSLCPQELKFSGGDNLISSLLTPQSILRLNHFLYSSLLQFRTLPFQLSVKTKTKQTNILMMSWKVTKLCLKGKGDFN